MEHITTLINEAAKASKSLGEFRSHIKTIVRPMPESTMRTDLFRPRLTRQMWTIFKKENYIAYPDDGLVVIMSSYGIPKKENQPKTKPCVCGRKIGLNVIKCAACGQVHSPIHCT